jgi:hypothetical protein
MKNKLNSFPGRAGYSADICGLVRFLVDRALTSLTFPTEVPTPPTEAAPKGPLSDASVIVPLTI